MFLKHDASFASTIVRRVNDWSEDSKSENPELLHGHASIRRGNDDMIHYLDTKQSPRFLQSVGKVDIVFAGSRVAAGVIVGQHDAIGTLENRGLEHFPRVHEGRSLTADGGDFVGDDAVPGVEVEDNENLPVRIPKIIQAVQVGDNIAGADKGLAAHVLPYLLHGSFYDFEFHTRVLS